VIALCACSNAPQELPTVKLQAVEKPNPINLPDPNPVRLLKVKFIVITDATLPSGKGWTYIAMSPKDYENLSKNHAELLRWVREAKTRLKYYREQNDRGRDKKDR